MRLIFDFETRSACDLKKAGAYKYSLDRTTQPTCMAFKVVGLGSEATLLTFGEINGYWVDQSSEFRALWERFIQEEYEFTAHNAFFERCIYTNIMVTRLGWPPIPFRLFRCTAAKAAACALPRSLDAAGEVMELRTKKDKVGSSAMLLTCRPTRKWNNWNKARLEMASGKKVKLRKKVLAESAEPRMFLEYEDAPEVWETLYRYCKIDVLAEEELDLALPDLIPQEQKVWFLNQQINWRGFQADTPTIDKIVKIMEVESKKKLTELDNLTMGLVTKPGSRKAILDFLELEGVKLTDIRAKTVDDNLQSKDNKLSNKARGLLELRKALSMTSTKKYQAFLNRASGGGRVRDILLYHGASTGRDTGTGIQPQNFPKGLLKVNKARPYADVDNVVECDYETLQLIYGDSLAILFSSILRNMIVASPKHELFVADFAKIEVAVLWWLAGNEEGLKVLRSGKDPYIYQAAQNLGKTYEQVDAGVRVNEPWAIDARQLGKAQILGCGFGMGHVKFKTTAWDMFRLELSEGEAKTAVNSYRQANRAVPALWKEYEKEAVAAVNDPGGMKKAGKCKFKLSNDFLWVGLPSGRRLAYHKPEIEFTEDAFGNSRESLNFWAVNSKTKKWALERTWGGTLTENIVQATARDLLMHALLNLEAKGYRVLLSVHDEAICEKEIGKGDLNEFNRIMCTKPPWAEGLPLEASGWKGPRYRK